MIPSKKTIVASALVVAIGAFVALMAVGLANRSPVTGLSGFTRVNKPAPPFTLPKYDGGQIGLDQREGKPVVINFWASWCPPCRVEAPLLEALSRRYTDEVLFIGVDIQDSEEDGTAYLREFGITYPNGIDADGRVTVDYGVVGLPVTFFVGRSGIVERRWVGAVSEAQMTQWLEELVSGAEPSGDVEGENLDDFFKLN